MDTPEDVVSGALARMAGLLDQATVKKISPATLVDRLGSELRTIRSAGIGVGDAGLYDALVAYETDPSAPALAGLGRALVALRAAVIHALAGEGS